MRSTTKASEYCTERGSFAEKPTKLVIKMRSLNVKRPKCRSKLVVMASLACAVLIVFTVLVFFAEFSSENEGKVYDGE